MVRAARRGALLAAVLLVTVAGYVPAVQGPFVFDDGAGPLEPATVPLQHWSEVSFLQLVRDRPLTTATLMLQRRIFGLDPFPFHLANVAVHLLSTILAFAFARWTFRRVDHPHADGMGLFVAAVFALHPLQSQSVSYVSQRSEALASAIILAALLLLARAEKHLPRPAGIAAALTAAVCFGAAFAAKPIAATAPLVFLLHGALLGQTTRRAWGLRLVAAAPSLITVTVASVALVGFGLRNDPGAGLRAGDLGPWRYFLTQASVVLQYLRLLLWPAGLSIEHDVRPSPGLADVPTLAAVVSLAAVAVAASFAARRAAQRSGDPGVRIAGFGTLMYLLALAPTSSFVPLDDLMFEHRTYLANLGAIAALAALAHRLLVRLVPDAVGPRVLRAAAAVVCAALALALFMRNQVWTSDLSLWSDAVAKAPRSSRARVWLAGAYARDGRLGEAEAAYLDAIRLRPNSLEAHVNLANLYDEAGRGDEALQLYEVAAGLEPRNSEVFYNLAVAYLRQNRFREAEEALVRVLELNPGECDAYYNLGLLYSMRGETGRAIAALAEAVRIDPRNDRYRSALDSVAQKSSAASP